MAFEKPLYVRGFQPPRRNRFGVMAGALFVLTILIVNYAVFFRGDGLTAPTLDQRLAKPLEAQASTAPIVMPEPVPEARMVDGAIVRGETASQALSRLGVASEDISRSVAALSREVDLRTLKPGQKLALSLLPEGRLASLTFPMNETDYFEVTPTDGAWMLARKTVPTEKETVQFACVMRGSLFESVQNCGEDASLAALIADLLAGQIDFYTDSRRGDIVRIIVEKENLNSRFLRYGEVHGLMYDGKLVTASAFPHKTGDEIAYFDASGDNAERPFLRSPLKYSRLSSDYSLRRLHPILHTTLPHRAQDYAAPKGTPVMAVGNGKVLFKGPKGANGNLLVVDHGNGFQTYYAHLSNFAKGLKIGDKISKSALIGFVGTTGRSTGPHLHYAVAHDGQFIHPRKLSELRGDRVPPSDDADFRAAANRTLGELKALPVRGVEGSRS